jgi:type VII secretion integral membrane protein EccD
MTTVVVSVLAMRLTGGGVVTLTALCCFAGVVAAAALAALLTAAPWHVIGSVSALASLALLEASARLSMMLSGLSRHRSLSVDQIEPAGDLTAHAIRADAWLTSLTSAFSASAAGSAVVTALAGRGASNLGCVALAALTGAVLLLRALDERRRTVVFIVNGIVTAGTTFTVAAATVPARGAWIAAATALAAAAAIYLGFVAPARPLVPVARRGVEVLECVVLVAMVPLTCWICGLYSAVRGMDLR